MCGIAGWAGKGEPISLESMVGALNHRGPDEMGTWESNSVALGISRLAIIDVHGGHQPVFSTDNMVVAVCNGEIYNFQDLAAELKADGIRLHSGSDVEVIPHLYKKYGLEFVNELRGMFAIAIWDIEKSHLFLARDRVGKKPLYYVHDSERFLFASEARAILGTGWKPQANLCSIDHLLAYGYLPTHAGAFDGLKAIPPGCIGTWDGQLLQVQRYWNWQPQRSPTMRLPSGIGWLDQLESTLDEAVRVRLVSERPIGSFLSGGIDSTVVTALMARHHSGPIKTFTIGFADADFDESVYSRGIAKYLGTDHSELILEPDPVDILTRYGNAFDQPLADSSALPTLLLSELAAKDVVVALSGDGGDEGFGGYERYAAALILQMLNPLITLGAPLLPTVERTVSSLGTLRLKRLAQELRPQPKLSTRYQSMMEYQPISMRAKLWTSDALDSFDLGAASNIFDEVWNSLETATGLSQMRAMDVATYLPGDLLTKVDISSMSQSLEVRSPFLDQKVLALAAQMPNMQLIRGRTTKWIVRQLAYRLVPRELVDRPKKGFGIPRASWLRGPLRELARDLLLDDTARNRGWFRSDQVEILFNEHERGNSQDLYLWPLLVTEIWCRRWLDVRH